jgi:hypothetical protein
MFDISLSPAAYAYIVGRVTQGCELERAIEDVSLVPVSWEPPVSWDVIPAIRPAGLPKTMCEVLDIWEKTGQTVRALYNKLSREERETEIVPIATFAASLRDNLLKSLHLATILVELFIQAEEGDERAAFVFEVPEETHLRVASSKNSFTIYPDVPRMRAWLNGKRGSEPFEWRQSEDVACPDEEHPRLFDSKVMTILCDNNPLLPRLITRGGRNAHVVLAMIRDLQEELFFRSNGPDRIMSEDTLTRLLGAGSRWTGGSVTLKKGDIISMPEGEVEVVCCVGGGIRNDGIYRVKFRGKDCAMKILAGRNGAQDEAYCRLRSRSPSGAARIMALFAWHLPHLGTVRVVITRWVWGDRLIDVQRIRKGKKDIIGCHCGIVGFAICQPHSEIRMYLQLLRTLYRMHMAGVTHGHVHAQNVIVAKSGAVLVDLESASTVLGFDMTARRDVEDAGAIFGACISKEDLQAAFPFWAGRGKYSPDLALLAQIEREVRWGPIPPETRSPSMSFDEMGCPDLDWLEEEFAGVFEGVL